MKTKDDIVQTLGGLHADDRKWIVDRLPQNARKALLEAKEAVGVTSSAISGVSKDSSVVSGRPANAPAANARRSLEEASASNVLAIFSKEPAWITQAVLQAQEWPWTAAVRRDLSPRLRSELSLLESAEVRFSASLIDATVAKVSGQLQGTAVSEPLMPVATSTFEKLVGQFRSKLSQQRLGFRS